MGNQRWTDGEQKRHTVAMATGVVLINEAEKKSRSGTERGRGAGKILGLVSGPANKPISVSMRGTLHLLFFFTYST